MLLRVTEVTWVATTKETSKKQEKLIADYLGWDVVSGSGARLHPGDIVGDDWLGECKTHMKPTDKIVFNHSVYLKIISEAMSIMKKPVLFCDDGTQTIQGTYVLVSLKHLPDGIFRTINYPDIAPKLNINISKTQLQCHDGYCVKWNKADVMIMRLEVFKVAVLDGDDLC